MKYYVYQITKDEYFNERNALFMMQIYIDQYLQCFFTKNKRKNHLIRTITKKHHVTNELMVDISTQNQPKFLKITLLYFIIRNRL